MNIEQAINILKSCKSVSELCRVWKENVQQWSACFYGEDAKEIIRVKDDLKGKLALFEEWVQWYEERSAIREYEGKTCRRDADKGAKDDLLNCIIENHEKHVPTAEHGL